VPGLICRIAEHLDRRAREALRIEFDTNVLDTAGVEALIGRWQRVVAMTAESCGGHDR
jgi:hypothetical protein